MRREALNLVMSQRKFMKIGVETESWKTCTINDLYEVSSMGRVRALSGKILTPYRVASTGYMQIRVGGRKKRSVHRLVALAFCSDHFEGAVVNHKNGIRDDNRAENLEWVTRSENIKHAYSDLGVVPCQTGKRGHSHHTSKPVYRIDMKTGERKYYEAAFHAVKEGFDSASISRCCHGKIRHHKGFFWQFALGGSNRAYRERGVNWSQASEDAKEEVSK